MVVPTELTPVLDDKNNIAASIRSLAILCWSLYFYDGNKYLLMYAPIYILENFLEM